MQKDKKAQKIIEQINEIEEEQERIFWKNQNNSDGFIVLFGFGGLLFIIIAGFLAFTIGSSRISQIIFSIGIGMEILLVITIIIQEFLGVNNNQEALNYSKEKKDQLVILLWKKYPIIAQKYKTSKLLKLKKDFN